MSNSRKKLGTFGIKVPEVMLPKDRSNMDKWAVIACDQYTSQKDYWRKAAEYAEGYPSTLNLVFPECYLDDPEPEKRIRNINNSMREYINSSVLEEPASGFILVKRDTPVSESRWGLVAAVDLEHYDYSPDSTSLVRATEGTILDRIPPRVKIRENAELELPHIMVLMDDPGKTVIEALINEKDSLEKLYDFDLMMNSGHLTAYRVDSERHIEQIAEAIAGLASAEIQRKKYNSSLPFLFAMGDGNHSLATAKTIWEKYKRDNSGAEQLMEHPSRWALVELVNIYSGGIQFEAIHRLVFNCNTDSFFRLAEKTGFIINRGKNLKEVLTHIDGSPKIQTCGFCTEEGYGTVEAPSPDSSIAAGTFQNLIDSYLEMDGEASVDYIHGIDVTESLGRKKGNIGIFLPAIPKDSFFRTIVSDGAFPRKTFSMGEAFEKRFYVEARRIK